MRRIASIILALAAVVPCLAQSAFTGRWYGRLTAGQTSITIVFNISEDETGAMACTMDSPDQGATGISAMVDDASGIAISISVPSLGVTYKGTYFMNSLAGTFTQMGRDYPLTLKKGEEKLNRPQTPQPPFPYTAREVSFTNAEAGATLAGTLVIPQGASADTPVIIMVSGSGLENRDEEIFDHKPFLVLADHLARHGVASLRYDDRSYGQSKGGDIRNATTPDFRDDAKAGIEFLRQTGLFGKIGVLGHSEGASIAFMLGASGDCDFVISLAGIGVKGEEALLAQANKVLELSGTDQRYTLQQYRQVLLSQNSPWMNWFASYNPQADIRACKCPVFAANGDKDIQVISAQNLTAIRGLLPDNSANRVMEYPGLNHLFQHCTTGNVTEYRSIEETISTQLLQDLADWCGALK